MRAAIDLAEAGLRVILVESTPALGGRVAQLGFMFPTHDCVLCRGTSDHGYGCTRPAISPAFLDHNLHPNIEVLTHTQIVAAEGQAGDFTIHLRQYPRYVKIDRCINCGLCAAACPVFLPSGFQIGLSQRKAVYKSAPRAIPDAYVVDKGPYCQACGICAEVCPTQAIDLNQEPVNQTVQVRAVILAIGYSLTDLGEYEEYGWGRYANVIHSMQYERLASRSGPTEGIVVRPSDNQTPRRIAWLQCIGSRDQRYPYCSSICCMYATKEAMLAKQRLPSVECSIFMMDERAFNKEFNAYYEQSKKTFGVEYVRCRASAVKEDPETSDLILTYVQPDGRPAEARFNMVVLSVGTQPPAQAKAIAAALNVELNPYDFCATDKFSPLETSQPGVYVCGTFQSPKEIAETIIDAAGAAGDVMRLMRADLGKGESSRQYPFISDNRFAEERDISDEAPRVGVYVCDCHPSIDSVVDTSGLVRYAAGLPDVVHAARIGYGCFKEGQNRLQEAIGQYGLNRLVIAGCSHRTHESLFQRTVRQAGLNPYLLEMVNIREHCAWVHSAYPQAATRKAKELLRGSINHVRTMSPVHKQPLNPARRALIIGGGVAGMTAALSIGDSGYDVVLVERSAELGGNLRHVYYVAEGQNPQRLLRDLVNRVRGHERITVFTRSQVIEHTGSLGRFRSVISTRSTDHDQPRESHMEHGVTIVATGGAEWRGEVYLLGRNEQVITSRELEQRIVHRPEAIAEMDHVVLIQCVRSPNALDYCSRICCTNSMKNAIRVKLLNPNCRVTVLYKDIITYGFRETYYREARRRGVIFIRYDDRARPVVKDVDGQLQITVWEPVLKRVLTFEPDLLTLNMAVVPAEGTPKLARVLGVPLSREGFFMEAHLKMRPMDFIEEGIFVAGMAHYPKFIEEAIAQAQATAGRAITLLAKQPLYIGGSIAVVDQTRCVGCLTCVRTCPFGIPQIEPELAGVGDFMGAAQIDPARCQGCGTCTAECPAKAIQLVAYTDEQILAQGVGAWQVA
jgi:heterodisulfide reductase subunit A